MRTLNRDNASILVVSDNRTDAVLVRDLLKSEYPKVAVAVDAGEATESFDKHTPDVLVLAYDTLEKSERYYLGLYRQSRTIHLRQHRTVILCKTEDVIRAYEMCRKALFDDYMLFWPMTHDTPRLRMSVHLALRELAALSDDAPTATDFARQARQLGAQEPALKLQMAKGGEHIAAAAQWMALAEQNVGVALDGLSQRLAEGVIPGVGAAANVEALTREIDRVKRDDVGDTFRAAADSMTPVAQWAGELTRTYESSSRAVHALESMAERLEHVVLVVDDDEFQRKLVARILDGQGYRLLFAIDGMQAIGMSRKERPDLILMDISMPGMNGIEATRQLKSMPQLANVPVIMFTAKSEGNVVAESLKAGARDFVVKPFDRATLVGKVAKVLHAPTPQGDRR